MQVKGTTVKATPEYVQQVFGDDGTKRWLDAMPPVSRALFTQPILTGSWYDLDAALIEPHRAIVELFHGGDAQGGLRALGRFSADFGLRGIYKMFIKLGTPGFIISRGSKIFSTLYTPGRGEVVETTSKSGTFRIIDFPEPTGLVELRIAGWMERALELSGCAAATATITHSISRGDDRIEFHCVWE